MRKRKKRSPKIKLAENVCRRKKMRMQEGNKIGDIIKGNEK